MKLMNFTKRAVQAGFTMIELLVVIAILGILAVVVLGTINPLEQINRGRDTTSRTDAEALITAVERYYANAGYFPWMEDDGALRPLAASRVNNAGITDGATPPCGILDLLGPGTTACPGTLELKESMTTRLANATQLRSLYAFHRGTSGGDSTYVCFHPQSNAFEKQALDQCTRWSVAATAPTDVDATFIAQVCPGATATNTLSDGTGNLLCLP